MSTLPAASVVPASMHRASLSAPHFLNSLVQEWNHNMHAAAMTTSTGTSTGTVAFVEPIRAVRSHASSNAVLQPLLMVAPSKNINNNHDWFLDTASEVSVFPQDEKTLTSLVPSQYSLRHQLQLKPNPEPDRMNDTAVTRTHQPPHPSVSIVGHRGALFDELENTRGAFLRCADLGIAAVELDVFLLPKDGSLIVFHGGGTDENPGDLTDYCLHQDGRGIMDLTYEECNKLEFNPDNAEFPCPIDKIRSGLIPTLEQVLLDLKPSGTIVKIELKGPGVVEPVLELVERLGMIDQCQYSSFDHERLALLRRLRPDRNAATGKYVYQTGALFDKATPPDDFIQQAVKVGASEVHLRYDACTVDNIRAIHNAGMGSMAWFRGPVGMKSDVATKYWDIGNEDASCYKTVMETGVEQLCCNRPDVLVAMLLQNRIGEGTGATV
jgi:glycerophosphoryl diester phosphodiesterase